ncbi:tetratricopeptide repeat protein [bacterium]|nr:tetratricopeptide repeat protein [bacterium]
MSRSLVGGNSGWPGAFTPEAEIVYGKRQMIRLAEQQIEVQKTAAQEIVKSNIAGAQVIAAEIGQQNLALDRSINQVGDRISDSISFAADQISYVIGILGDRLCTELSEINWQLAQQNKTLEQILDVLRNSRNNETQQLVQQGVRHYVNKEYEEAEERFRRALEFDTTDYQVLMNLAYIEIHKDNAPNAFTFFKKAISLPENLDSASKARTLWAIARLFYAEKDYAKAFSYAEQAFRHDNHNDPKAIYALGVYAALAGKTSFALDRIKEAITINVAYFVKTAVDPDLGMIRQETLNLLSDLSVKAQSEASKAVEEIKGAVSDVEKEKRLNSFNERVKNQLNNANEGMKNASYSFCLHCADSMNILKKAVSQMKNLIPLYSKETTCQKDFNNKNERYLAVKSEPLPNEDFGTVYAILILIGYILIGYLGANAAVSSSNPSFLPSEKTPIFIGFTILWPLTFLISLLGAIVGVDEMAAAVGGYFKGFFIVAVFYGIVTFIQKQIERDNQNKRQELSNREQQMDDAKNILSNIQNQITAKESEIKEYLVNIRWQTILNANQICEF